MATLHRLRQHATVWMSLIVVVLLSACGAPATPTTPAASSSPAAQPSSQPSPSPSASPAPSAAPASPATELPTPQPSAATEPSTPAAPETGSLSYFWPANLPSGFEIRPARSSADASGFSLDIGGAGGQPPAASIVGGKSSPAGEPPTNAGQMAEIRIRNTTGTAYDHSSGYSIFWEEQGVPYAIIGDLSIEQGRAIADALQPLDLAAWQKNLASAPAGGNPPAEQPGSTEPDTHEPTPDAFYLFPDVLPDGLEVRPVGASADASGFSLNLGRFGQQEPVAMLVGGKSSPANEPPSDFGQMAEITVRTNKATAYDQNSGYSIFWEEQGVPYAIIGDLTLEEARAVAEGLQSTNLEGWQMKLAEVGR